ARRQRQMCIRDRLAVDLGERFGLWVVPGIEVETKEEVHLLGYFPTCDHLLRFNRVVSAHLPLLPLNRAVWGEEWVVDEDGHVAAEKDILLAVSLRLSLEEVVGEIQRFEGVPVLAHVDRKAQSVFSQLGFIPPGLAVKVLEISSWVSPREVEERFALSGYRFLRSSDAHALPEVGRKVTFFRMATRSWDEFLLALFGEKGRNMRT
ncbi:MAG: hypothetical protein N2205_01690, partial [Candidatus Caldatribacterium sp.]|nr:hypothetical protein [Candidatus Caldatribacterium sp.]